MMDLIHHPFGGAFADALIHDPLFAFDGHRGGMRGGRGHRDLLGNMDHAMAQAFGEVFDVDDLHYPSQHRRAIEQHERNGTAPHRPHRVVYRRHHSRDYASGRERFCEHRAIDDRYHTLHWDTDDIDERGEVRHHTARGLEQPPAHTHTNALQGSEGDISAGGHALAPNLAAGDTFDEGAFERDWQAAGIGLGRSVGARHTRLPPGLLGQPQPQPSQPPQPPQSQQQQQQQQQQRSGALAMHTLADTAMTDRDSEGHVTDSADSDDEDESKVAVNDDAMPLFEFCTPGQRA